VRPIEDYFGPYGTLSKLRGSNLRSFFERIKSPFDLPDPDRANEALKPFVGADGRYECAYCGDRADEWDHIDEAGGGGSHQLGNLLPACRSCNRRKKPWLVQLNKVGGEEIDSRKKRIDKYMSYLSSPGHKLFDEESLLKLHEAEKEFFAALAKVDAIIEKAIQDFKPTLTRVKPRN
jgi:HNH endonuclease